MGISIVVHVQCPSTTIHYSPRPPRDGCTCETIAASRSCLDSRCGEPKMVTLACCYLPDHCNCVLTPSLYVHGVSTPMKSASTRTGAIQSQQTRSPSGSTTGCSSRSCIFIKYSWDTNGSLVSWSALHATRKAGILVPTKVKHNPHVSALSAAMWRMHDAHVRELLLPPACTITCGFLLT